jgi:AcrR family transcriptional regulator
MPKIVDHEAQREKFAEAAIRLVAREGFEGMTMRAVAAESGLSYGSLFHYFDSKDDLLVEAVRHLTTRQAQRVNAFSSRERGLRALEQLLMDDVLVDADTRDESVVWLAFLYRAALERPFAVLYRELIDGWLKRIRQMLEEAVEDGELESDLDRDTEAQAIWSLSAGIVQQGLLHPSRLPPARQRELIRAYLQRLQTAA